MKIIALEEHTVDRAIGAATAELCKNNVPYLDTFYQADMPATPTADSLLKMGEYRLADMDRCGIDMEVLSLASYDTQWVKGNETVTLAQNANNYLASLVKEHPSRFRFFATLPWSNPQAAADYPYIPQDGARPFLRERTAVRGGQGEVRLWQCGKVVTFVTA